MKAFLKYYWTAKNYKSFTFWRDVSNFFQNFVDSELKSPLDLHSESKVVDVIITADKVIGAERAIRAST